ncbi:putative pumilio 8, chloroplastic [Zea mays]|uniref:Putative pumilio 8, chloroplastic n=1 Tax=Zea mays TaxID=4577 RepID=A0A3L6FPV7_MAIZE|nr:putative pumilio 8, chloroplastic [Zea mays]
MVEYGKLLEMMVSLSINNQQSALALPRMREGRREEDDDAAGAAAAAAAAADRFSPAFLGHHRDRDIIYPRAYAPAPPIGQEAGPSPSQMHPASVWMPLPPCDLSVPDARPFAEGRSIARGARNEPAVPPAAIIAAARGPRPDGHAHAYMAPPPYLGGTMSVNRPNSFHRGNEEALLLALSEETPEIIVSYACHLLESRHGQRLFRLVFNHCNQQLRDGIVATITRDKKSFGSLCTRRPDEVVHIISSCATRRSMQLLGDAMLQWMAHNQMRYLLSDSKRLEVLQTFILRSPPDIAQFIFEAVAQNCTRLAYQQNGLRLLQNCLDRVSQKQKDYIFTQLSYESLFLAQDSSGNWIVQDVLRRGDPSHIEIIASCLRNHYVTLAKNKYSSNVVEWCLRVFHEEERSVIVYEFISYSHFRDLVTDEFANFALSTALQTCEVPLRNILANAILSQNIIIRNQHCIVK